MINTNFSKNWNGKLCNENFGTCRLHNEEKYFVGAEHEIILNKIVLGTAKIYAVRTFPFKSLRDAFSWIDSGMPAAKYGAMLKNMYKNKDGGEVNNDTMFDHIIYHWKSRNYEATCEMFTQYFEGIKQAYTDIQQG